MSTTLSYGFVKPVSGDVGNAFFTPMEANIQQLNDHTHNGTNSANLPAQSILGVSVSAPSGSWVANGATGHYRQSVTLPAGFSFDTVALSVRTAAGIYVYSTIEKISATQFYVYTTDNTLTLTIICGG